MYVGTYVLHILGIIVRPYAYIPFGYTVLHLDAETLKCFAFSLVSEALQYYVLTRCRCRNAKKLSRAQHG